MVVQRKKRRVPWSAISVVLVLAVCVAALIVLVYPRLSAQYFFRKQSTDLRNDTGSKHRTPKESRPSAERSQRAANDSNVGLSWWWYTGKVQPYTASIKDASTSDNPGSYLPLPEQDLATRGHALDLQDSPRPSPPPFEPQIFPPPFEGMRYGKPERSEDNLEGERTADGMSRADGSSIINKKTAGQENVRSASVPLKAPVVCWNGPPMPWLPEERKDDARAEHDPTFHIQISGEGCASCIVGLTCEFLLRFIIDGGSHQEKLWQQELMVTLTGPALLQTSLLEHKFRGNFRQEKYGRVYSVTYSSWDPGRFNVDVRSDCFPIHLALEPGGSSGLGTTLRTLAQFGLQVLPIPPALVHGNPIRPTTPCDLDILGRWKVVAGEEGREAAQYIPFECLGDFFPVNGFVRELVLRELAEISFVGGSHQLALFLHLQSLLTGGQITEVVHEDEDITWAFTPPGTNLTLRMNFYWMENIFKDNEYGCGGKPFYTTNEGRFRISPKSKIIILEATSWGFEHCTSPEVAYIKYLPWLLDNFVWWYANNKVLAHVFWRSAPPFPVPSMGCQRSRNRALKWANNFARSLTDRHGFSYLDFWSIEAPFYDAPCPPYNAEGSSRIWTTGMQYSCLYANNTKIQGPVGEAVAQTLIHKLSGYPTPQEW